MTARFAIRASALLAAAVLACTSPTSVCGCPPSRSMLVVRGSVQGPDGQAMPGARVTFSAMPVAVIGSAWERYESGSGPAWTAADGSFHATAYSVHSDGPHLLRISVVRPAVPDTTHVELDVHDFRYRSPETIDVTIAVP